MNSKEEKALVIDRNIYAFVHNKLSDISIGEMPNIVNVIKEVNHVWNYTVEWTDNGSWATAYIKKEQVILFSEMGEFGKLLYG